MPKMHLRHLTSLGTPGFIYNACGSFTKIKERIQKLKKNRRCKIQWSKQTRWNVFSTWLGL